MATRAQDRDDPTNPSEIPTALIEEDPFGEDEGTVADDPTTAEGRDGSASDDTPTLKKFRRPTRSEIARAVDQVNTEAVDVEELARAQAAARAEDTDDIE